MTLRMASGNFDKNKGFNDSANKNHSTTVEPGSKEEVEHREMGWKPMTQFETEQAAAKDDAAKDRERAREQNDAAHHGKVVVEGVAPKVVDAGTSREPAKDETLKSDPKAEKAAEKTAAQKQDEANKEAELKAKADKELADKEAYPHLNADKK